MLDKKETFVKLNRGILDWQWYQDANTFRVFVHLLLVANIKEDYHKGVLIHRGERALSYRTLSEALDLSIQQVRTSISKLKKTGEVTITRYRDFLVVSVTNYNKYQEKTDKSTFNQQSNNIQITFKQQSNNNQLTTNKESKESKECKEVEEVVVPTPTTTQNDLPFYSSADYEEEEEEEENPEYDKLRKLGGRCEGLILSSRQMDDLIETMGDIDVFEMYCQKLIKFIKEKGATNIKSHYATLLKWYKQDTKTK